jgi:hypothetical protein
VSVRRTPYTVIAGLDPAIQVRFRRAAQNLDHRVSSFHASPGDDGENEDL